MTHSLFTRVGLVFLFVIAFAVLAPTAAAVSPAPGGTYNITFYNYVTEEGGAACPSGGTSGGTDSATGTFHFWGENAAPYPGASTGQYTVCWDGWINFPSASSWAVQTINDDGMDIWVDGNIVMRAWYDQGPTLHNGSFDVDPNVAHHVVIKYYNQTLAGTACVGWGVQGDTLAYWNCPTAQTVSQAPTYTPPTAPPMTPPYVPPYVPVPPYAPFPYPGYTQPALPANWCVYVIRRGDTLSRIAAWYRTSFWTLAYMNRIPNPNRIYAGTAILVPNCR